MAKAASSAPTSPARGATALDYFLENIVDPNAVVGEQFQLTVVTKKDGTVVSGISDQETPTALTLRTITENVVVPKSEIKEREKLAQSLMPPGLLEALPERKAHRAAEVPDQQEVARGFRLPSRRRDSGRAAQARFPRKMSTPKAILYVKTGCPYCQAAMDYLDGEGVEYERIDVRAHPEKMAELEEVSGQSRTPTLVIDGDVLPDFGVDDGRRLP